MLPVVFSVLFQTAAQAPAVSASECDFGEAYPGNTPECLVEFTNPGDKPVRLHGITGLNGDTAESDTLEIPPNGTKHLRWRLDVDQQFGNIGRYLKFYVDGEERSHYAKAYGFVANVIDQPRPELDLGVVDLSQPRIPAGLSFTSREASAFRITKVLSAPDYLDIKIGEDGKSVSATVKDGAAWGVHVDYVKVAVDAPQQSVLMFLAKSVVQGDVVASSNPFELGMLRTGTRNEAAIRVERRSGGELKLGKLSLQDVVGKVTDAPCVPAAKNCRMVKLLVSDEQRIGRVNGVLQIDLPQDKRTLPVTLNGFLIKKDTVIRDFDKERAAQAANKADSPAEGQSRAVTGQKFTDAVRMAAKNSAAAPPEGKGPLIRWQVANETGLHGYIIYRAESADGPYLRVNKDTIKIVSEDNSGSSYMWRDATAESGRTYWYYVGTVSTQGEKKRLTDQAKVVAK